MESLLQTANSLMEQHPGYRVEIIGGIITVAPLPDGRHANALAKSMIPFLAADLHGKETRVLQGIGLWLPGGPEDYAIPDLAIVDADRDEHLIENNCYDPAIFRLVLEVTSSNYNNDLRNKVAAYAEAKIPVYVIVDRKHGRVHVLTAHGRRLRQPPGVRPRADGHAARFDRRPGDPRCRRADPGGASPELISRPPPPGSPVAGLCPGPTPRPPRRPTARAAPTIRPAHGQGPLPQGGAGPPEVRAAACRGRTAW